MPIFKVTKEEETRLLDAENFEDLARQATLMFGTGTLSYKEDELSITLKSDTEWNLSGRVSKLNFNRKEVSPPPYEKPPLPPPSLVQHLRSLGSQNKRLDHLKEVLDLKAEEIVPILKLFIDKAAMRTALELILRPSYTFTLNAYTVKEILKRSDSYLIQQMICNFPISCTLKEFATFCGPNPCTFLAHVTLNEIVTLDSIKTLFNLCSSQTDRLNIVRCLTHWVPFLHADEVIEFCSVHFASLKIRKQAINIFMERS